MATKNSSASGEFSISLSGTLLNVARSYIKENGVITFIVAGSITIDDVTIDIVDGFPYVSGDLVTIEEGYFVVDNEYLDMADGILTITDTGE